VGIEALALKLALNFTKEQKRLCEQRKAAIYRQSNKNVSIREICERALDRPDYVDDSFLDNCFEYLQFCLTKADI